MELSLTGEHRRGHGALYDGLGCGQIDFDRPRRSLSTLTLPRDHDGRIVLAVDISAWLRPDAPTSPQLAFCHVYGRGKNAAQLIPGWPYSFIAALEPGRSSWTAVLDAVRLHPDDNETAVTAIQIGDVVTRLQESGQWKEGDPDILLIFDSGYELARLAFLLADLPVVVLGRMRSDRVLCFPAPPPGRTGRPPRHGAEFRFAEQQSWPTPAATTNTGTDRYGTATRRPGIGCTRGSPTVDPGPSIRGRRRSSKARSSGLPSIVCPGTAIRPRCGCGARTRTSMLETSTGCGSCTCAASISSTPSDCSSKPWAGRHRRSAAPKPPTAGPGW